MVLIKKYGVWLALLLTIAATVWISQQEEADDLVVKADKSAMTLNGDKKVKLSKQALNQTGAEEIKQDDLPLATLTTHLIQRSLDIDVPKNIFTPFVAMQNNPDMNAEPAITLPVNPFVYAGKIIQDGTLVVFLIDGEKSHAVKSGDVIEDIWKVKSITPPTMTLKNIPLKFEIQMEIGANS
ncbi:hypothetical protein [Methylotenera sp.]|uniref:hypothetical protein n=1 Tax=Methylotenera sp. TaxID=2051956 RepID=UPI002489CDE9|nr:hypothetical protein [Methylotenera sp.]MDI1361636.1 hypothetical protein [Methylotenera sp.]